MTSFFKSGAMLASLVILTACGGGSSTTTISTTTSSSSKITISGTAATGLAIGSATVSAKCAVGTGSAVTDAKGVFTLTVTNGSFPCLLQVTNPLNNVQLHGLALSTVTDGTANLTPLTEMATARVLGSTGGVSFAIFDPAALKQRVTATTLATAQSDVLTVVGGVVDATNASNFMTAALVAATASSPGTGNAQDVFLDSLGTKLNSSQINELSAKLAVSSNTAASVQADAINLVKTSTTPPTANAGANQNVITANTVTLDGSASTAARTGATLTYQWVLLPPSGSKAALSNATSAKPTFFADVPGQYTAFLTVSDGKLTSTTVPVTVTASLNSAPVAKPVALQSSVLVGATVTLDGSGSTDANGDKLAYEWTLTGPEGSTATLSSAASSATTFVPNVAGDYVARLVVNDGSTRSEPKTVVVTATSPNTNAAPVANAGAAQSVLVNATVTLDGSASSDANASDVLTFAWTLANPSGASVALSSASATKPTFVATTTGAYVATLVVTDGKGGTSTATTTVTVLAAGTNVAPVAKIVATPTSTAVSQVVTLDATTSTDSNGDKLTYAWTLTTKPSTSKSTLSSATADKPTFTPDVVGDYVVTLVVDDGKGLTATASKTITVTATSSTGLPVAKAGAAQTVYVSSTTSVKLDGTASTDASGVANASTLTYAWTLSKPAGSTAVLLGSITPKPTFFADVAGEYKAELTVKVGEVSSVASTVVITARKATANTTPVADAGSIDGESIKTIVGKVVTLDGTASKDADGDTLTYKWILDDDPAKLGTVVKISDATASKPTVEFSAAGTYYFTLVVNDGQADSVPVTVGGVSNSREKVGVVVKVPTNISGVFANRDLTTDIWSFNEQGSPYNLTGDVTLSAGNFYSLTVDAGVEIYGNGFNFFVEGPLEIKGTAAKPVLIQDVNFIPVGDKHSVKISHANITGGMLYPVQTTSTGSSAGGTLELSNSVIRNSSQKIYLNNKVGGLHTIVGNTFSNTGGISFELDGGQLIISNNLFKAWTTGAAIEVRKKLNGSSLEISKNTFQTSPTSSTAISLPIGAFVVADLEAQSNYWGTEVATEIDGMILDKKDGLRNYSVLYAPVLKAADAATPTK